MTNASVRLDGLDEAGSAALSKSWRQHEAGELQTLTSSDRAGGASRLNAPWRQVARES